MKTIENITSTTSSRYAVLFDKATKALVDAYVDDGIACPLPENPDYDATAPDVTRYDQFLSISSMEEYFKCLGTLFNLTDGEKFVFLLPLDEPRFEINADTREITIPKEFSKGIGVQGDVISETILFRINRFVDAMDLHEVKHIYVQWQYGPDTNPTAQGVSEVQFRHIENQDYLVFAWPITNKVTDNYGNLKFTVRFMTDKDGKVVYSLNTKPATVIINKALNAELDFQDKDYTVDNEAVENLFKNAINNSIGSSEEDDMAAAIPSFKDGQALVQGTAANNYRVNVYLKDNAFNSAGYAVCQGSGHITYKWGNPSTETADPTAYTTGAEYSPVAAGSTVIPHKRYYIKDKDNAKVFHQVELTGTVPNDKEYFEYRAYLTIPDNNGSEAPIIGDYVVNAENRIGWAIGTTRGTNQEQILVFAGPQTFEFSADGNLSHGEKYVEIEGEDGIVNLFAKVDVDTISNADAPLVKFEWQKNIYKPAAVQLDPNASDFVDDAGWVTIKSEEIRQNGSCQHSIALKESDLVAAFADKGLDAKYAELPGWYRAIITDTVNRNSKVLYTTHCRVTDVPVAAELSRASGSNLAVDVADPKKDYAELTLSVKNMADYLIAGTETFNELKTDASGLTYAWYGPDDEPLVDTFENGSTSLKDPDKRPYQGVVPADGNISVKVKNASVCYCVVKNSLNGKNVESTSGLFMIG